jgi:protein-tyrosine phosphatase
VHCSQGIDRTGYVIGAYLMKNKNKSFKDVIKQNS